MPAAGSDSGGGETGFVSKLGAQQTTGPSLVGRLFQPGLTRTPTRNIVASENSVYTVLTPYAPKFIQVLEQTTL